MNTDKLMTAAFITAMMTAVALFGFAINSVDASAPEGTIGIVLGTDDLTDADFGTHTGTANYTYNDGVGTLELNDFKYKTSEGCVIVLYIVDLVVKVTGDCSLESNHEGISTGFVSLTKSSLTITGDKDATLSFFMSDSLGLSSSVYTYGSLTVTGGLTINSYSGAGQIFGSCGLYSEGPMTISDSTVNIVAGQSATGMMYGICSRESIVIEDSDVNVKMEVNNVESHYIDYLGWLALGYYGGKACAIYSGGDITVSGDSVVNAKGGDYIICGWKKQGSTCGMRALGDVIVKHGAELNLESSEVSGDAKSYGIDCTNLTVINGSKVSAVSAGHYNGNFNMYSVGAYVNGKVTVIDSSLDVVCKSSKSNVNVFICGLWCIESEFSNSDINVSIERLDNRVKASGEMIGIHVENGNSYSVSTDSTVKIDNRGFILGTDPIKVEDLRLNNASKL